MRPLLSIGFDRNGNRILRVKPITARGFSVQTLGNLPETHRNGIGEHTPGELRAYVSAHGTPRQNSLLN